MIYKTINLPLVTSDIINAVAYYKEINPKLANQFLLRIKEAKDFIEIAPFSFQIKYLQVRTVLLKQFPYHLHYVIDEERNLVVVLAIIHSYKEPKEYSNR
jgi:hypothetical protein